MMPLWTTTILPVQSRCGMRVLFGRTSVRRPARVADAVGAVERLEANDLFEVAQLAFRAPDLQAIAIAGYSDASGIVSAIFQTTQAVNDDRNDAFISDVSNNAAHVLTPIYCPAKIGL